MENAKGRIRGGMKNDECRMKNGWIKLRSIFSILHSLGAPIFDPARFSIVPTGCRVGDRRSGGSAQGVRLACHAYNWS
jgi:hypothetical protein